MCKVVVLLGFTAMAGFSRQPSELKPGPEFCTELLPGAVHTYRISLNPGTILHFVVDQRSTDVVITADNPNGAVRVDSFEFGREPVSVPSEGRSIRIGISPTATIVGTYCIREVEVRTAGHADSFEARAIAESTRARELSRDSKAESLREALKHAENAVQLWRGHEDLNAEARAWIQAGEIHHALSEYHAAITCFRAALDCNRPNDQRIEAQALSDTGISEWQQGRTPEALAHLQQARTSAAPMGMHYARGAILNNLGLLSWQVGDVRDAVRYYEEALEILAAVHHRQGQAFVANNIALAYASLGEYRKALAAYARAIREFLALGNKIAAGRALSTRAKVYLQLDRPAEAQRSVTRALAYLERGGDERATAEALNNLGQTQYAQHRYDAAMETCGRALGSFRKIGDRRGEANALMNLGRISEAQEHPAAALRYFGEALELFRSARARESETTVLFAMARVLRSQNRIAEARARLESAMSLVDAMRWEVAGERMRATFFASRLDVYQAYVDLLMKPGPGAQTAQTQEMAFETADRARSRGVADLLAERLWEIREDGSDTTASTKEKRLHQELNYLIRRFDRMTDREQERARSRIDQLSEQIEALDDETRIHHPRFAELANPRPVPLREIQRELLEPGTLLLEYWLAPGRSYLWAITCAAFHSFELPPAERINPAAKHLAALLSSGLPSQTTMRSLARHLLTPVRELVRKSNRILIVGDGELLIVPFAALPSPDDGQPLVAKHELVRLPSAAVMVNLRRDSKDRKRPEKLLAIVADPVVDGADVRLGAKRHPAPSDELTRLPFSGREAKAITSEAPKGAWELLTGFEATKDALVSDHLDEYRYIHLSTHGILDTQQPELSGLMFSRFHRDGTRRDGFLSLYDVYNIRLNAGLVTLSACRTGLGRPIRGEGLIGLTRGFLYAGAAAVVSSLFPADDEASSELMARFYEGLLGPLHLSPGEALHRAQNLMRQQTRWREPQYWAAFVLQGEWKGSYGSGAPH